MQDVVSNINRPKQGARYPENTKCFAEAMRMYRGKRMCDLFTVNFDGPEMSIIKRTSRKGIQFIPREHA
jgi:hypothetical protein